MMDSHTPIGYKSKQLEVGLRNGITGPRHFVEGAEGPNTLVNMMVSEHLEIIAEYGYRYFF